MDFLSITFLLIIVLLIFVPLSCVIINNKRLKIAIIIGFIVSIISFIALLIIGSSPQREIYLPLLCIFYLPIIAFLVIWNLKKFKRIYLLLCVPVICVVVWLGVFIYYDFIKNIPTVDDEIYLGNYAPFGKYNNLLAKLDEKSNLKITDNLPVLDGATAFYPVYASFVESVYPEGDYWYDYGIVLCSKTETAYENLLNGQADIIFCLEPSSSQMMKFHNSGKIIQMVPIGREAFVFFVNKNNPVNNVTVENIRGIYSGKIKNWNELNGKNQKIRAFQRQENSGSQTIFEKIMGNSPVINPGRENVSMGMGRIINQVAVYRNFPNAIGYSFLHYSTKMVKNNKIKLLSINGTSPSNETIEDGSYPFLETFYAIYIDSDEKNENIELFIEWILSNQGQTLILKTGYIPIRALAKN